MSSLERPLSKGLLLTYRVSSIVLALLCFKPKLFCPESETEPTLVLVPGLAFTKNGKRMGRGKGYYDKYLTRLNKQAGIAGICLQFQLVGDLPADEHDIRMDFIFQE